MNWLRVFWLEALVLPAIVLWVVTGTPTGSPYRTLNLVTWSAALVAAIAGLAYTRRRRTRGGTDHGSSAH